jgi:hypothetical protein
MRRLLAFAVTLGVTFPSIALAEDAIKLDPYGFVRLDAVFQTARTQQPQYAMWVLSDDDQPELVIYPRLSRFGVDIGPYELDEVTNVSAKFELDFHGGGSESRANPRMRVVYVDLETGIFQLRAGQDWDLISPLYPAANHDGMMWNAGNLGDRRPQARATFFVPAGDGTLRVAAAAGMTGAIDGQDLDDNGRLDGWESAIPTTQGLVELDLAPIKVGGWGHVARERLAGAADLTSFAVGAHAMLNISDFAWVQGEGWFGQDLSDVRGGIAQPLNGDGEELRAAGGWLEAAVKPVPPYTVAAGFTIDNPIDDLAPGQRSRNLTAYLVNWFRPWDPVKFGLEYVFWQTQYQDAPTGVAHRVVSHLMYIF